MKKTIFVLVGVIMATFSIHPATLIAEDKSPTPCYYQESNESCVQRLVVKYAKEYKVSSKKMMQTLENENNTFDFDRQSDLVYKKGNRWKKPAGSREQSFGIAMIHLPDHPDITIEEATDPEFAIAYMAKEFSKGHQRQWMGYEG